MLFATQPFPLFCFFANLPSLFFPFTHISLIHIQQLNTMAAEQSSGTLKLESSDNKVFTVPTVVAQQSVTIKNMLEGMLSSVSIFHPFLSFSPSHSQNKCMCTLLIGGSSRYWWCWCPHPPPQCYWIHFGEGHRVPRPPPRAPRPSCWWEGWEEDRQHLWMGQGLLQCWPAHSFRAHLGMILTHSPSKCLYTHHTHRLLTTWISNLFWTSHARQ